MKLCLLGESHSHSSQHLPGTLTRLGMGQSGLGSRTSMEQRGTQPTAPSRQVHWYLQLLWKDSPLLYTMPPNTQGVPSRAARTKNTGLSQRSSPKTQSSGQMKLAAVSPVHTPMRLLMGAPKSQYRPLCGSHTSFSVHSSPICLAHTRQQPQPSSTRLTPGAHWGGADGHEHWLLHS